MTRTGVRTTCVLLLLIPCTGCDGGAADRTGARAPAVSQPLPARPARIQDTLMIEGVQEIRPAILAVAPDDFMTSFSTYVPEGLQVEFFEPDSAGFAVRFFAAFTGERDPNAYMHVFLYPAGTREPAVEEVISSFVASRAPAADETVPVETPPWAVQALGYRYRGDGYIHYTGGAMIARHGNRFLHIITHYPVEYGDGLAPRFERILQRWRWEDTGEMLIP